MGRSKKVLQGDLSLSPEAPKAKPKRKAAAKKVVNVPPGAEGVIPKKPSAEKQKRAAVPDPGEVHGPERDDAETMGAWIRRVTGYGK